MNTVTIKLSKYNAGQEDNKKKHNKNNNNNNNNKQTNKKTLGLYSFSVQTK